MVERAKRAQYGYDTVYLPIDDLRKCERRRVPLVTILLMGLLAVIFVAALFGLITWAVWLSRLF